MSFDTAISLLSHSNWGFLVLWVVLLGIAFVACFSETSAASAERPRANRSRR
jgi:hypothetical protein